MAIPFHLPSAHDNEPNSAQYARIEQMLNEMMAMMRNATPENIADIRVPYHAAAPVNFNVANNNRLPAGNPQQNPPIYFNPVLPQREQREQRPLQPAQQDAEQDLIASCAAELANGKVPKTVVLKVKLCESCLNYGGTLKVIGVTKVMEKTTEEYEREIGLNNVGDDDESTFIATIPNVHTDPQVAAVRGTSNFFKWPALSLLKLSSIDTAIVAAAVAIIGWKIFTKQ